MYGGDGVRGRLAQVWELGSEREGPVVWVKDDGQLAACLG